MMKSLTRVLAALLLLTALAVPPAFAQDDAADWPVSPTTNDGRKWRIGYYEGGQYPDYEVILKATVRGLIALGWMEPLDIPDEPSATPAGSGAIWLRTW